MQLEFVFHALELSNEQKENREKNQCYFKESYQIQTCSRYNKFFYLQQLSPRFYQGNLSGQFKKILCTFYQLPQLSFCNFFLSCRSYSALLHLQSSFQSMVVTKIRNWLSSSYFTPCRKTYLWLDMSFRNCAISPLQIKVS